MSDKLRTPIEWQVDTGPLNIPENDLKQLEAATSGEQMIPLTSETLCSHLYRIIARIGGNLAGYTGIVTQYKFTDERGQTYPAVELGGSIILPGFRGMGIGTQLYRKRLEVLYESDDFESGTRAVVFTNKNSRPHVESQNFQPLGVGEALSQEAFRLCTGCTGLREGAQPADDPTTCCDYEGIFVKEIVKK